MTNWKKNGKDMSEQNLHLQHVDKTALLSALNLTQIH